MYRTKGQRRRAGQAGLPGLVDLPTREQIHQFLQLPGKPKALKGELTKMLLALIEADDAAKGRFYETFKSELAVGPWDVEEALYCTATERKRWTEDGKLPVLEYRTFHKAAQDLSYPVYERRLIFGLSEETLTQWRAEHQALVQLRRKTGARKAAERRSEQQQARQSFQQEWQAIVAAWSEHGSPELSAALQLAYWTVWAVRWAEENQLKRRETDKDQENYTQKANAWQERKNRGVRLLAHTPYAQLSFFRPKEPDKRTLSLCGPHQHLKREGYYESKWDFYIDWGPEVRRCPACKVSEEQDFYSSYILEVRADIFPDLYFAFHTPYLLGKTFWPSPATLPQIEHIEQHWPFSFGRALLEEEKILNRENDVLTRFEAAFAQTQQLFGQTPASSMQAHLSESEAADSLNPLDSPPITEGAS